MDSNLWAVAIVSLLAAVSPGPDFFIVLKNSLSFSRKSGLLTACGISAALIIHLTYTLVGIGVLISESPLAYLFLKYLGVAYIFYIGISSLISSFKKPSSLEVDYARSIDPISASASFIQGFFTNLLNPKAAIFFISLFSQFIDSNTPLLFRVEYAFVNWTVTLGWFLFLAYLITAKQVLGRINQFRLYIDRIMGGVLMLLGFKLLLL